MVLLTAMSKIMQLPRIKSAILTRTHSQFSSVSQSYLTLCDPIDYSTPGLPFQNQLPEFTQTHGHWVGDATKPPHPLSSSARPTFNLSQHQGHFKWVSSLHQVTKKIGVSASISVFPMYIWGWFPLGWTGWVSLQFKGLSSVFNIRVKKHQFFSIQLSLYSNSHIHTWIKEKP